MTQPQPIFEAELVAPTTATAAVHGASPLRLVSRPLVATLHWLASILEWLFGVATLIVGLATLASLPIVQFLSMGYLLEVAGRIARSGRLREGFIGIRKAARIGGIVAGTFLLLLIPLLLARLNYVASLVDAGGSQAANIRFLLIVVTVVFVGQILWAWYRGGRLRNFFWPAPLRLFREFRRPDKYRRMRDAVWEFTVGLRLPYYFWLGLRGFAGTLLILVAPISLFVATASLASPAGVLVVVAGGFLLALTLMYLPFLQARFAAEGRFRALFEVGEIRRQFRCAPLAFLIALIVTLAGALPLYLLKVEWTPREVAVLIGIVFVVFMFPARVLCGFALARAGRQQVRHAVVRWAAWLLVFPTAAAYVFIIYFFRFFLWNGHMALFEQHAFLLPIPFLGY